MNNYNYWCVVITASFHARLYRRKKVTCSNRKWQRDNVAISNQVKDALGLAILVTLPAPVLNLTTTK